MPPEQQALALHRSFALLAPLYREGVTAVSWPLLQQLPGLAERLPPTFDPDAAAAVHYRLFHFNLFPYESFFLDESGLLGGERTAAVTAFYQQAGFSPQTAVAPDHISQQLALLAFLCGAEADAGADGLPAQVGRLRRLRHHFYRSHLLRWLPPFLTASTELLSGPFTPSAAASPLLPFYDSLVRLTGDLIAADWSDLTAEAGQSGAVEPLPALSSRLSLAHEKTGLKQIATYLLTPVHSGLCLSRDMLGQLARQHNLPRGFGDRRPLLLNLLDAAVQYDALPALINDLQEMIRAWLAAYATLPLPTKAWADRCRATLGLLQEMDEALSNRPEISS